MTGISRTMLTPDQAARRAGCGRSSVMRALTSGQLHGVRANTGRWRISSDELERWISDRPASEPVTTDQKPARPDLADMNQVESLRKERDEARIEAATLRVELNQFHERLTETAAHLNQRLLDIQVEREREVTQLREDRDRWHTLATTPEPTWLARLWTSIGRPLKM